MPGLGFDLFEFAARTVRDHAAALLGAVREREPGAIDVRGLQHSPADAAPVLRLVPQQADASSRSHTATQGSHHPSASRPSDAQPEGGAA